MKKNIVTCLILIVASAQLLFARVGSGHSGGGGSHSHGSYRRHHHSSHDGSSSPMTTKEQVACFAIIGIGLLLYILNQYGYFFILKSKMAKIGQLLKISESKDKLWREEYLQRHVEETYRRLQKAWTKRNMDLVSDLLTKDQHLKFTRMMYGLASQGKINFIDRIKIDSIKVVGMEDRKENNKDKFTALVKGTMVDEMIEEGQEPTGNGVKAFEDLYHFIRYENRWLLSQVDNELSFWNTTDLNSIVE